MGRRWETVGQFTALVRGREAGKRELVMCLTLGNAATVLDHHVGSAGGRGYVRTCHHIGYMDPGDLWIPDAGSRPHTVVAISRRRDRVDLTDQYGVVYPYPNDAVIQTAVPDLRVSVRAAATETREIGREAHASDSA